MADLPLRAQPFAPGAVLLGRYEVARVLGRGAMGEVLAVRDRHSGANYALKRIPPELVRDEQQMRLVRSNYALVSQLTYPHIAATRYLEVDPASGDAFLIMDLIHGADLGRWLAEYRDRLGHVEAPIPLPLALGIAEQIAAALDYAHALPSTRDARGTPSRFGILHRDLKPANIMVEQGHEYRPGVPYVKLVDFGLAAEIQGSMQSLTGGAAVNAVSGTPAYMAPEQWEGRTLTRGVDQWALAVIFYEMVAGRRPFNAPSSFALMMQVKEPNPEPPPTLTPRQWHALSQAFYYDRRMRYRSCTELVRAVAGAEPATEGLVRTLPPTLPDEFPGQPGLPASPVRQSMPQSTPQPGLPGAPHKVGAGVYWWLFFPLAFNLGWAIGLPVAAEDNLKDWLEGVAVYALLAGFLAPFWGGLMHVLGALWRDKNAPPGAYADPGRRGMWLWFLGCCCNGLVLIPVAISGRPEPVPWAVRVCMVFAAYLMCLCWSWSPIELVRGMRRAELPPVSHARLLVLMLPWMFTALIAILTAVGHVR